MDDTFKGDGDPQQRVLSLALGSERGDSEPDERQDKPSCPGSPGSSEHWSEITDPFQEFHLYGALQAEESHPQSSDQPVVSGRTQFLRAVSLFSPVHQLAMLEVREEQGVSLLERTTTLTAESLDEVSRKLTALTVGARRETLPESETPDHLYSVGISRDSKSDVYLIASPSTPRSQAVSRAPSQTRMSPLADSRSRRVSSIDATETIPTRRQDGATSTRRPSHAPSHQSTSMPVDAEFRSRLQSSVLSEAGTLIPGVHQDMDPAVVEALRALWTDPEPERRNRRDSRRDSRARSRNTTESQGDQWPDVLSGLWRMLDSYDEFVCSPPNFHAFRQDKPHWLDQEPIPWPVRENAREKCTRWLQSCPIPA